MAYISISGRVSRPETKNINGVDRFFFSIPEDVYENGETVTRWWGCSVWDESLAARMSRIIKKGSSVHLSGEFGSRLYQAGDGQWKVDHKLKVHGFEFNPSNKQADGDLPVPSDEPMPDVPF